MDIFKDLIWNALVKFALAKLFEAIPFLAWGPVGLIVGWLAGKIADYIYEALSEAVNFELIVIRKVEFAKEYALQSYNLKMIAQGKGIDSDEFKAQREIAKAALSHFIKFGA